MNGKPEHAWHLKQPNTSSVMHTFKHADIIILTQNPDRNPSACTR